MTTPKEIQAALSELIEFYEHYAPKSCISTKNLDRYRLIQSHAPEASPVDADQLKRPVEFNRQGNQIINLYNDGYNDAINELLRRGFRQGGGKGDVSAHTGLKDRTGKWIESGQIVHWSDGGEDLDIETRIRERWDRIAVVIDEPGQVCFRVIDSPHEKTKAEGHTFGYGSFIYTDTENHLTILAESENEYRGKFENAEDAMRYQLTLMEALARCVPDDGGGND